MPGLERPWGDILAGSQTHVFLNFPVYAAEWEAVAGHSVLATPCWIIPLVFAAAVLKQTVAKKELEM